MAHSAHHYLLHHIQTSKRTRRTVDSFAYVVAVVGNFAVIPQAISAWQSDAPGLSISTWAMFLGVSSIWLIYAVLHRQKPLIVGQIVILICDAAVVAGWIFHHWIVKS